MRINADRLHESLRQLCRIGATPGGGVTRLALSDEDRSGARPAPALDGGGRAARARRRLRQHDRAAARGGERRAPS